MEAELLDLISARRGHFRLESGHHGNLWLDLDSLFLHPAGWMPFARVLARRLSVHRVEAAVGPLVGGAFVAQTIGVEFPVDLERNPKRLVPLSYADAVLCQVVQVLRAIKLEERPAVDGQGGASCIRLIEQALSKASPLPEPWLTSREQAAAAQLHGSAR